VVGSQKIVRDLNEALRMVREYSLPLEDARMKSFGRPGSLISKVLLLQRERPGRVTVILLEEPIGFQSCKPVCVELMQQLGVLASPQPVEA
jgi:hypothetical protein